MLNADKGDDDVSTRSSLEVDADMAAELLRANVRLEGERDRAQDEVEQLTTQLKDVRTDLDARRTDYQRAQRELDDALKRLASTELDCERITSKCDVRSGAL